MNWMTIKSLFSNFEYGRYTGYILALIGALIAFKIRLSSADSYYVALVNSDYLFFSAVFMMLSLFLWLFSEFLFSVAAPKNIIFFDGVLDYLSRTKSASYDEEHWRQAFDSIADSWIVESEEKYPGSRIICSLMIGLSIFLGVLSVLSLFSSCYQLLLRIAC